MLIGYARVSKHDDSQVLDSQIDALVEYGIDQEKIYSDRISGKLDTRPGLDACLKALRKEDQLIVFKLDRLGRDQRHLLQIADNIQSKGVVLVVLSGMGKMDTSTSSGKLMFSMFAAFAEFERELMRERTLAGLKSARARGRTGGRPRKMTKPVLRTASAAMKQRDTVVSTLCKQLKISRSTLYTYVSPKGQLTEQGKLIMKNNNG